MNSHADDAVKPVTHKTETLSAGSQQRLPRRQNSGHHFSVSVRLAAPPYICSREHEQEPEPPLKTLATPHTSATTGATQARPATGTESMAETTLKPLKAATSEGLTLLLTRIISNPEQERTGLKQIRTKTLRSDEISLTYRSSILNEIKFQNW